MQLQLLQHKFCSLENSSFYGQNLLAYSDYYRKLCWENLGATIVLLLNEKGFILHF